MFAQKQIESDPHSMTLIPFEFETDSHPQEVTLVYSLVFCFLITVSVSCFMDTGGIPEFI